MNKQEETVHQKKTFLGCELSFAKILKLAIFVVIVVLLYMLLKDYVMPLRELPPLGISSPSTLELTQMTAERR